MNKGFLFVCGEITAQKGMRSKKLLTPLDMQNLHRHYFGLAIISYSDNTTLPSFLIVMTKNTKRKVQKVQS